MKTDVAHPFVRCLSGHDAGLREPPSRKDEFVNAGSELATAYSGWRGELGRLRSDACDCGPMYVLWRNSLSPEPQGD
jgi:hypothetical protein